MTKLRALLIVFLMSVIWTVPVSCTWTQQANTQIEQMDPAQLERVNSVIEIGSRYATSYAIKKNPKVAPAMSLVAEAISAAVQAEKFQPVEVTKYIDKAIAGQSSEVKDLVHLGIDLAMVKYREFYELNVQKYKDEHHVYASFLSSIGSGIRSAVSQSVDSTPAATALPGDNPAGELTSKELTL